MPRKRLTPPPQPSADLDSPEGTLRYRVEYRFKLLFLPLLSFAMGVAIFGAFFESIFLLIAIKPVSKSAAAAIEFLLVLIIVELMFVVLATSIKLFDIKLTTAGIKATNLYCIPTYIEWQQIIFVKSYFILGIRTLAIKTKDNKSIDISPRFYRRQQMLDRVRELAGEDHMLVRAMEKELSRPRRELTKIWAVVIGSIALTISLW